MKISNLLRWGPRKSPESPASAPKPPAEERSTSDRRRVAGPAQLWWVSSSGEAVYGDGAFRDAGDHGVGAELDKSVPVGKSAWFTFDSEQPWPAIVRHSEVSAGGFRVGASIIAADAELSGPGWGSVGLEWFDSEGSLQSGSANIRSGSEGQLELNADSELPTSELLLLKGTEVCCLAITQRCELRGDRYFVAVEVLTESAPKYSALAA